MNNLWKDVRYALRVLGKSPGFTAVVVLSLALGIGANTAIFNIFNAFLLRPMPVDAPDRLVAMYGSTPSARALDMSYPQMLDLRKQDTGLSDLIGFTGFPTSVTDGEKPEVIWGELVTGNYFSGLGVHPVVGRGFLPEEDRVPDEKPVCVLSYKFWQRHFQGDPNVAGRTIKINNHPFTIVGVAPQGFIGARLLSFLPDVWVPVMMAQALFPHLPQSPDLLDQNARDFRWLTAWGRLKPGVTRQQAETALNVVARQLGAQYPETDADLTLHLIPGGARTHAGFVATGMISAATAIMAAVSLLVLLIACSNVANVMLARAATRTREMAIRVAIGATRARLVRQLITESVLLSLAGGAVGVVLSLWFGDRMKNFYPTLDFDTTDMDAQTRFDPHTLVFALLVSLIAAVIFGLVPALRASKVDQASAMKTGGGTMGLGTFRIGSGNLLVMAQVALSCVLLVVGGLFLRSMQFARSVDPGFDRTGITIFTVNLEGQGYDEARASEFHKLLVDRLRTIPGVDSAAVAFALPLDAYDASVSVLPEGYVAPSKRETNSAGVTRVGPHYFETMGTRLVAGRAIDERDTSASRKVAVINETMARRYWRSPELSIGHRFKVTAEGHSPPEGFEIVGVARDGKYRTFGEGATPFCFLPLSQYYSGQIEVLVRSKQDTAALVPAIRQQVASLDSTLPIFGIRDMPQFLNRTVSIYDMGASLIGTFAIMAMLLAAVGIYGVLHFTVARRTREIGIRMALGAGVGQVLRPVLQRSLGWVLAGLALGIGLAMSARGITQQLLAGVSGVDPLTFCAVLAGFGLIVMIAAVVPARRAARIDPIRALRDE
jgi:predicted permease